MSQIFYTGNWEHCEVFNPGLMQNLEQAGVVPDFAGIKWFDDPKKRDLTVGAAYERGELRLDGLLSVLRKTLRGGVGIHVPHFRNAAVDYDTLSCGANNAQVVLNEHLQGGVRVVTGGTVKTLCERFEVKAQLSQFNAAHKALVSAAKGLLDARQRYALPDNHVIAACAEIAEGILYAHKVGLRTPGALKHLIEALLPSDAQEAA